MRRLVDGFGMLEAARWHVGQGLLFSDMTRGGVYRYTDAAHRPDVVIAHRKGIGGLVAHEEGGLVIAGRNVAHKAPDGTTTVLLETGPDETFFNDLTADGSGRLVVGSVGTGPSPHGNAREARRDPGRLYRVEPDGSVTVLSDDVLVSNGLGVSPAGDVLYHVDSYRRTVWAFDRDDNRTVFVDLAGYDGIPDGLTVTADGAVFVAMAGGGGVLGFDARGAGIIELSVDSPLVTSVTFGGPGLQSLFVLTGVNDEYPDERGGAVYVHDALRPGLPAPLCTVGLTLAAVTPDPARIVVGEKKVAQE
jgi:gluconolactonase